MLAPMKLMITLEFGSTAAVEISVFQGLLLVKGRNPFRFAPCPVLIALQAELLFPPGAPEPFPEPLLPPEDWPEPAADPPPQPASPSVTSSKQMMGIFN